MNWKQLKDFCNNLSELELEKKVMLWRENEALTDISVEQLDEYHYIDPDDSENGCFPELEMKSQINMSPNDFPHGIHHFTKVYDKGHPILHENF